MRRQNLKWVAFLAVSALFGGIFPFTANASVKIDAGDFFEIMGDEIEIH